MHIRPAGGGAASRDSDPRPRPPITRGPDPGRARLQPVPEAQRGLSPPSGASESRRPSWEAAQQRPQRPCRRRRGAGCTAVEVGPVVRTEQGPSGPAAGRLKRERLANSNSDDSDPAESSGVRRPAGRQSAPRRSGADPLVRAGKPWGRPLAGPRRHSVGTEWRGLVDAAKKHARAARVGRCCSRHTLPSYGTWPGGLRPGCAGPGRQLEEANFLLQPRSACPPPPPPAMSGRVEVSCLLLLLAQALGLGRAAGLQECCSPQQRDRFLLR
jgi:hypothetical protein